MPRPAYGEVGLAMSYSIITISRYMCDMCDNLCGRQLFNETMIYLPDAVGRVPCPEYFGDLTP